MNQRDIHSFQKIVLNYYAHSKRDMPWRRTTSLYAIIVSEIMLQQTQVARVIPKFKEFVHLYPNFRALSRAKTSNIYRAWSGLGYNRRAKSLRDIALILTKTTGKKQTRESLVKLPGIGPHTAGAIIAYTYDTPVTFIETNIRTVFIHHFFGNTHKVSDKDILPLVEATLPRTHIREWYWALMDYGAHLKHTLGNLSQKSTAYKKQTPLQGSVREARGAILRHLTRHTSASPVTLARSSDIELARIREALKTLTRDGMIRACGARYTIA